MIGKAAIEKLFKDMTPEDWEAVVKGCTHPHPYYQKPQSEPVVEDDRHDKEHPLSGTWDQTVWEAPSHEPVLHTSPEYEKAMKILRETGWKEEDGSPVRLPREPVDWLTKDGWKEVVYAHECDENGHCPKCVIPYEECPCPGPTMDDHQYVLIARPTPKKEEKA